MPGMAGRKSLPTHLKILKGTHQPCRDNREAPTPAAEKPSPPGWLSKRSKQIFGLMVRRQEKIGIASATFTEPLALLASRLEEIELLEAALGGDVSNWTYTTDSGIIKARPEKAMLSEAKRHAQSLLAECCLTITASQRVSAPGKKRDKTEWE